jgi:flavin-dependent dehydrogenase
MPRRRLYDSIVVGGGPAGLLVATAAAENGLGLLLQEQTFSPEPAPNIIGKNWYIKS